MTVLKPVSVDILMPLMASSLDAAVLPAANAKSAATSFVQRFADHDAVGATQLLDDATNAGVAGMVSDVSNVGTTIKAVHHVIRSAGLHSDGFTDATVRRIADGASRLSTLPTNTPRNVYMAAVSAEKTAAVMQSTLDELRAVVNAAAARVATA